MIKRTKLVCCNFELGDFKGTPSFLTDVPVDLLTAFIDYHRTGYGIAHFDEEGSDFYLVITGYSIYIIEEKECAFFYDFNEMSVEDLENEVINDIKSDLNGWVKFTHESDIEEISIHRDDIWNKLCTLEKIRSAIK